MRRIVLLLALAAIMAAVMVGSGALPAAAQGMNCGWWWDWWSGWYWACY